MDTYFFKSDYTQVTGKIEKVLTTSASTFGELKLQALSNISNLVKFMVIQNS